MELVRGRLVREPRPGGRHGRIAFHPLEGEDVLPGFRVDVAEVFAV